MKPWLQKLPQVVPALYVAEHKTPVSRDATEKEWGVRTLRSIDTDGYIERGYEEEWYDPNYHTTTRSLASMPTGERVNNHRPTTVTKAEVIFDSSLYNADGSEAEVFYLRQRDVK